MNFRVLRQHMFRTRLGAPDPKDVGDEVRISQLNISKKLMEQGVIGRIENDGVVAASSVQLGGTTTTRVGVYMHTSRCYSGGRLHIYQMAWTMAKMGAEVFLITDASPIWKQDYPPLPNLNICDNSVRLKAPEDLDLLFTDGKGSSGLFSIEYKRKHPFIPLIVINFETPNWVQVFDPITANKMTQTKTVMAQADMLICNSDESLKFLREYMDVKRLTGIVPPAVNTFAVNKHGVNPLTSKQQQTPYVVWSARSSRYKGAHVIINAVMQYKNPLNLVMIGQRGNAAHAKYTQGHEIITFKQPINDAQKMALMRDAVCVAAPSKFEGFGMVPGEALCNGTPVVVYSLPVLHQNYGERLIYAKWGDTEDFAKVLYSTIEKKISVDPVAQEEACTKYGFKAMKQSMLKIPYFNFNKRRVSAQMICYYGQSVQEAIAGVYDHVDEVLISHGPTKLWKDTPGDNSLELIKAFPDKDNKIKLIEKPLWENKQEMRQACQKIMTGNYLLIVDADEIYHNLDKWIEKAPDFGCPRWVHFWHDLNHEVVDASGDRRWGLQHELGGCSHNHLRWARWRASNKWSGGKGTVALGANGRFLSSTSATRTAVAASPETCIYHLGHVLPKSLMQSKHDFYLTRDGRDAGRVKRSKAWHDWNGALGNCGDGMISRVNWELPELVKQAFDKVMGVYLEK